MNKENNTRRDNHDGSIYLRSDGLWGARIMIGRLPNGKPRIKQFAGKTEIAVKRKLREFKESIGTMSYKIGGSNTVDDAVLRWLEFKKMDLKPLSYQRLVSTYNSFIKDEIGYIQFSQLSSSDIQNIIDKNKNIKSYSSLKKIYDLLNACCGFYLSLPPENRCISFNPCDIVRIPKSVSRKSNEDRLKFFSDDELVLMKSEMARTTDSTGCLVYPYADIYVLMLNTGCRLGEALALNKKDINLKNKTMRITKNVIQVKKDEGGYELVIQNEPKTYSGNRVISLNEGALGAINRLLKLFPDTEMLAINKNGSRVSPQNAEKTLSQILKMCGIDPDGRKCHALRHTFATKLFEQGVDIKIVSSILGHSSVKITYDIYVSVIQEQQAQVVNLVPEI